jgi:2-polyprenyl-3-methyl-5-hydroxy-6-metoxy-1,4-benzoquinol methylase
MKQADTFFHKYSCDFDAIYGNRHNFVQAFINRYLRKDMRLRFEKTVADCQPVQDKTVLDIGCGPGHYSVLLAKQGAARVHGVDFAPNMIAISQQKARAAGVEDRCVFEIADFMRFDEQNPYDFCILMGFMDYIADPVTVVAKAARLCKNKAFFSFPKEGGLLAWQRKIRYRNRCPLYLYTRDQIEGILKKAGCKKYKIELIYRDYFVTVSA